MNDIYNPSEDERFHLVNNENETTMRHLSNTSDANQKTKKSLECHAFVCNSQADAIAIAAQLYQALVETIRKFNRNAESTNRKKNLKETLKETNSCRVSIYLSKLKINEMPFHILSLNNYLFRCKNFIFIYFYSSCG